MQEGQGDRRVAEVPVCAQSGGAEGRPGGGCSSSQGVGGQRWALLSAAALSRPCPQRAPSRVPCKWSQTGKLTTVQCLQGRSKQRLNAFRPAILYKSTFCSHQSPESDRGALRLGGRQQEAIYVTWQQPVRGCQDVAFIWRSENSNWTENSSGREKCRYSSADYGFNCLSCAFRWEIHKPDWDFHQRKLREVSKCCWGTALICLKCRMKY